MYLNLSKYIFLYLHKYMWFGIGIGVVIVVFVMIVYELDKSSTNELSIKELSIKELSADEKGNKLSIDWKYNKIKQTTNGLSSELTFQKFTELCYTSPTKSIFDYRDHILYNDIKKYVQDYKIKLPKNYRSKEFIKQKDQGQTSRCAAFAASILRELHEQTDQNKNFLFSADSLYDLRKNRNDVGNEDGMYGRDLVNILKNKGISTVENYKKFKDKKINEEIFNNHCIENSISSYGRVDIVNSDTPLLKDNNISTLIESICYSIFLYNGCILLGPVRSWGSDYWNNQDGDDSEFDMGHAIILTGWDLDKEIIYFYNSWGYYYNGNRKTKKTNEYITLDYGHGFFDFEDLEEKNGNSYKNIWEIWYCIDKKNKL